jgi:6-phosphogluconolactonase
MNVTQIVDTSSAVLVSKVVDKAISAISHNWQQNRTAHIVLTGGRTGVQIASTLDTEIFRLINSEPFLAPAVLLGGEALTLHIWFSDERFTSVSDEERTDSKLIAAFEKCASAKELTINFHRVSSPENSSLSEAADSYARELEETLGQAHFDAAILSMGEDGHIASLFPGLPTTAHATKSAVAVDNSPKPPAERVSISVDRLARANAIYIFALGEGKREALVDFVANKNGPLGLLLEAAKFGQMFIATDLRI